MEIMREDEPVWEDRHHRSSFLPNASLVDFDFVSLISDDIVSNRQMPILLQGNFLGVYLPEKLAIHNQCEISTYIYRNGISRYALTQKHVYTMGET